mgnify:CR=1 FL=1
MAASSVKDLLEGFSICPASDFLKNHWESIDTLIVIGAIGAVVRLIAPLISSKSDDPAVIVIDANGQFIVPLLGGHKAGAEQIASDLAASLGGSSIFTGDSKTQSRLALDCFGESWGWIRSGKIFDWKELMIKQANGFECNVIQSAGSFLWHKIETSSNYIINTIDKNNIDNVSLFIGSNAGYNCSWHPATLWIGIGCERNTDYILVEKAIEDSLSQAGLSRLSVAGLASIDKKFNEDSLILASEKK